jgi:hypothetical protein
MTSPTYVHLMHTVQRTHKEWEGHVDRMCEDEWPRTCDNKPAWPVQELDAKSVKTIRIMETHGTSNCGCKCKYINIIIKFHSRGSSVSIVSWLRAGRSGFDLRQRQRIFLLAAASRPALGPSQPPVQWIPGVLSPGVKRPGRDADHSPHLVPRLSRNRSYTSSPPCASMACSGITSLFFFGIKFHRYAHTRDWRESTKNFLLVCNFQQVRFIVTWHILT